MQLAVTVPAEAILAAILGAIFGLAADRLAARWPAHEGGGMRPADWRTVVVVVAAALTFGALSARWSDPRDLLVLGAYAAALIVLLATDLDQRLLPDVITLPLIVYAALVTLVAPLLGHELNPLLAGKDLGGASAIAAGLGAPALLAISDRLFHGALGGGDLKLSVSIGLMCGVSLLLLGFVLATTVFAAVVVVLVLGRRITLKTAIPFGPALIGAALVAFVVPA
jgi:leader peptidase (prepilin peptidase)/N-methyltransferase